jgi:N4-gp56 family major capsid protein
VRSDHSGQYRYGHLPSGYDELQNEAGKVINIPLITRLVAAGVTGNQVLEGNEEALAQYNCALSVDWRRHAVTVPKSQSYQTEIDLLNAARDGLRTWEAEQMRDDIIDAMLQVVTTGDTTVDYASASAANRNAYAAANQDRLLFGSVVSNFNATFATALGNVDTTNDKTTVASLSLAKRLARQANPRIRPFKTAKGREYYVAFHGARTFRDLKLDSTMVQANRDARAREGDGMKDNPLFQDGDLIYDGIIHREVPEIDDRCSSLNATGASSADVRPVFLCGAQAIGVAWGQEPTPVTDMDRDYKFRPSVAIEELLAVKKMAFNGKQHGMVTAFFAAAADS